jgi:hypothetical protein
MGCCPSPPMKIENDDDEENKQSDAWQDVIFQESILASQTRASL